MSQISENYKTSLLNHPVIHMNKFEEAAALSFKRRARFVDFYYPEKEIEKICHKFFGSTNENQKNGLKIQYKKMKQSVIESKSIGLVILGCNLKDKLIDTYPTIQNTIIELTVDSICRLLLREYFNPEEVEKYCRETPNFEIYYQSLCKN